MVDHKGKDTFVVQDQQDLDFEKHLKDLEEYKLQMQEYDAAMKRYRLELRIPHVRNPVEPQQPIMP